MPLPRHVEGTPAVVPNGAPLEQKTAAPAAPEATKPGAPAAVAVAKQTPQPKEEGKKAAILAPGEKKSQLAKGGTQGQKGTAPVKGEAKGPVQENKVKATVAVAKPARAEKTTVAAAAKPAIVAKKQVDAEQAATRGVKKAVAASGSRWTVVVGPYLLEEALASDLTRVRKAGLSATIQPTARKRAAMNRLFLTQFDDRAAAQAELDKLKRHTSDAFILEHAGKHAVYAGSYLLDSRAVSEKERLAAAGFNLTLKRSEVAIPSKRLVVGTYRDLSTAENVQKTLKGVGLKGMLVRH